MSSLSDDMYSNRVYKIWLMIATLLFLTTLTAVIVIIIIANARQEDRELEFAHTLTAAFADAEQTQTALGVTPTVAPTVIPGSFTFEPLPNDPAYSPADNCAQQIVVGQVLDQDNEPFDGVAIRVWGDYTPPQTALVGTIAGHKSGSFQLPLGTTMVNRRVWVQVTAGERYLSAPVEVVFEQDACNRTQAEITFLQVAP